MREPRFGLPRLVDRIPTNGVLNVGGRDRQRDGPAPVTHSLTTIGLMLVASYILRRVK